LASTPAASQTVDLGGAAPVLSAGAGDAFSGPVPGDGQVLVSGTDTAGWQLSVAGRGATRQQAFGWAMLFTTPPEGGNATLRYATPLATHGLSVLQALLWLAAVAALIADRNRRRGIQAPPPAAPPLPSRPETPPPDPLSVGPDTHRRPRRVTVPDTGDDGLWT
jgi:hypothetical protein